MKWSAMGHLTLSKKISAQESRDPHFFASDHISYPRNDFPKPIWSVQKRSISHYSTHRSTRNDHPYS